MRALWAAGMLLRRLRTERGIIVLTVVLVAATSFLFAAAPRLFNRVADDALRAAAEVAPVAQRNLAMRLSASLAPGPGGDVSVARTYGDGLAEQLPPSVAGLVSERSVRTTTVRFLVPDPPKYELHVSLTFQDGLTDATRLVAGRWPVDRGVPLSPAGAPGVDEPAEPVVLEAAFSTAEATEIGVGVGDRLEVVLDRTEPLLARTRYQIVPTEIEVVGLYEPVDPDAEYWFGDASLLLAEQHGSDDHPVAYATAYIAAEMYPGLWASHLPFHYEWRFRIDPRRLDADEVGSLQVDLHRLGLITGSSTVASDGTLIVLSGLPGIVDRFAAERALSESVLAIAAIGPLGLAGAAVAMTAILLIRQRRGTLVLARGRGASGSLVLGTQLWEAILLAGGASLVGLLGAVVAVPARASSLSLALAVAVGAASVLLLVGASWPTARRPLGQLGRDDPPVLRVAPRRLVIEMTIVVVAVAATLLLRQRGLTAAQVDGVARIDPLLASVPVLSGLAAGILALRLYPLPIRGLGFLAARRRDIVPVLGLRTIGRHAAAANLSLLVIMLTAAFGAFSSVIASSIDRGQVVASYLDVGADFRLEKIGIGALYMDTAGVPGVEAVAPGVVDTTADFSSTPNQRATIYLAAIDPQAYAEVAVGTAAEPRWPGAFLEQPPAPGLGTDENPIPALLSRKLPVGSGDLGPGDTFRMSVVGRSMTFRLVDRRAGFPGIGQPATFAIVPLPWVEAAIGGRTVLPTVAWLRASGDIAGPLAATIAEEHESARIVSRYDAYAALHDAPLAAVIPAGYGLAVAVAAIYMALTVIGALILSAAGRTRDLAYLRTLGVSARQALALTVMEHVPPVLVALVPGVALGIGVAMLCEPGMGLAAFVGTSGLPLLVDWPALALMIAALTGVVIVAVTAGTWLSRRRPMVDALRIGED